MSTDVAIIGQFDFSVVHDDKREQAITLDGQMDVTLVRLTYTVDEIGVIGHKMKSLLPRGYFMLWYKAKGMTKDQMSYAMYPESRHSKVALPEQTQNSEIPNLEEENVVDSFPYETTVNGLANRLEKKMDRITLDGPEDEEYIPNRPPITNGYKQEGTQEPTNGHTSNGYQETKSSEPTLTITRTGRSGDYGRNKPLTSGEIQARIDEHDMHISKKPLERGEHKGYYHIWHDGTVFGELYLTPKKFNQLWWFMKSILEPEVD